jgi:hypothetical protein
MPRYIQTAHSASGPPEPHIVDGIAHGTSPILLALDQPVPATGGVWGHEEIEPRMNANEQR